MLRSVGVFEADSEPFHVGVYEMGDVVDTVATSRDVPGCNILTGFKTVGNFDFPKGDYFVVGQAYLVLAPDLRVVLDSDDQLFHVRSNIVEMFP